MFQKKTFWGVILTIWMVGSTYWHICHVRNECDFFENTTWFSGGEAAINTETPSATEDNDVEPYALKFQTSQATLNKEESSSILDSITNYLKSNSNQLLHIQGIYGIDEENATSFANLGLARAFELKKNLTDLGVSENVLSISTDSVTSLEKRAGMVRNAIKLTYSKRPAITEADLANDEQFSSIYNSMELYFPYASVNYIQTPENQKFLNAAKAYLHGETSKKLILTGHTDNEDSEEWNMQLSIKRANVVKQKLATFGIPLEKMIVIGKGETEPKASNSTIQGRRANRRVTIVVK